MRRLAALALLIFGLVAAAPAFAVNPDEMLKDPTLEARARVLSEELRCLVCQNQSIDDSDAALAHDIRVLLRERLQKGDTDQEAIDYLVARYGEFILLKPRFNGHTWLLWLVAPGGSGYWRIGGGRRLFPATESGGSAKAAGRGRGGRPCPPDVRRPLKDCQESRDITEM